MEDWELQAVATRNAVLQTMILHKNGGLQFYDIDETRWVVYHQILWCGWENRKERMVDGD